MKKIFMRIGCLIIALLFFCQDSFANSAQQSEAKNIPVLLYHHLVSEKDIYDKQNGAIITIENFSDQMKYLKNNSYTTITMDELYDFLYSDKKLPTKSVLITFDDGYYSNYEYAYPILKAHGFKASLFIITGSIAEQNITSNNKKYKMLDKESIKESKDVFTYYSHTDKSHELIGDVSSIIYHKKDHVLNDIKNSFNQTDSDIAFSYPYGMYNDTSIEILKELNVKLAFTTKEGTVIRSSDPYKLPRIIIYPDYSISHFEKIMKNIHSNKLFLK